VDPNPKESEVLWLDPNPKKIVRISVADKDPGSGTFLPSGSGIRTWGGEFFPDLGSPDPAPFFY
jgi:hypothetical protein